MSSSGSSSGVDRELEQAENDDSAAAAINAIAFRDPFADTTPRRPTTDNASSRSGTKSPSPLNSTGTQGSLHSPPSLGVQQLLSDIQPRDPLYDHNTPAPIHPGSDTLAYNNTSPSEEVLRSLEHHSSKLPTIPSQLQEQQQLDHAQANTGHYTHPSGDNTQTYGTPSAAHHHHSLKPIATVIMGFEKARKFSTGTSVHRKRQMSTLVEKEGHFGPALTVSGTSLIMACLTASTLHTNIGCPT